MAVPRSESWLTANWRPIAMLGLLGLLAAHLFGLTIPLSPDEADRLWLTVELCLGGYVAGRSVEKVALGGSK